MIHSGENEVVVLGGGCFWCMEAVFERIPGVESVVSGYAGGHAENPTYEAVCSGETGHAEVVRVEFDGAKIDFDGILEAFFASHDPTTENRQGADVGSQYRSVILYTREDQEVRSRAMVKRIDASGRHARPVVTELKPLQTFWPAEAYHQAYYERHPFAGYCRVVIAPKLDKLGLTSEALIK